MTISREHRRLKAYRVLHNVKQEELAKLLNIGQNTYSFKENGKKEFTLEESGKIADYFKTTVDDIFFNDEVNFKLTKQG